jgi:hypothetical protein
MVLRDIRRASHSVQSVGKQTPGRIQNYICADVGRAFEVVGLLGSTVESN